MGTEDFRKELLALVQARRPLILPWLEPSTVLAITRSLVRVGFPGSESHARDSLARDNQRVFLENLAAEILGVTVKLDLVLDPSLKPPPASELFDEPVLFSPPPRVEPPKPEPPPPQPQANSAAPETGEPATEPAPESSLPADEFHNDPLIHSAIETFKLKLASR